MALMVASHSLGLSLTDSITIIAGLLAILTFTSGRFRSLIVRFKAGGRTAELNENNTLLRAEVEDYRRDRERNEGVILKLKAEVLQLQGAVRVLTESLTHAADIAALTAITERQNGTLSSILSTLQNGMQATHVIPEDDA